MDGKRRGVVPRASRPHFTIVTRIRYEVGLQEQWRHAADVWTWYLTVVDVRVPPLSPPVSSSLRNVHVTPLISFFSGASTVYRVPIFRFRPNCTLVDGERFEKVSRALLRGHPLLWCVRECVVPIEWVHSKISALLTVSIFVHIKRG